MTVSRSSFRLASPWSCAIVVACIGFSESVVSAFSPNNAVHRMPLHGRKRAPLPYDVDNACQVSKNPLASKQRDVQFPSYACGRTAIASSAAAMAPSLPFSRTAALAAIASFLIAAVIQRRRIFYPGSLPDPAFSDIPMPPGKIGGCPFLGDMTSFLRLNNFLFRTSKKLGYPRIWKYCGFGKTVAVIAGSPAIKKFLGREFREDGGVSQINEFGNTAKLFGDQSMAFEKKDSVKYHSMR
mmetsp:Transcript_49189/g.91131  ORF Transcript_49189/g.91131 Transcript_49189/m.91131 type:complete len:240 (+) Transcript_49189:233-952(+)